MQPARRTLVVLGASSDQIFLIRTAQELGLAVLAVDRNPESPGFALAEEDDVASQLRDEELKSAAGQIRVVLSVAAHKGSAA